MSTFAKGVLVRCLPETLSFEDMLSPFSFVRRVALFVWSSCSGSSGSRRKMGWKCAASLSIGKHQSLRRSDAGRCRESKTTGQRVHEFSFFIACSSSCRIGPRASSFSIFWFVREQTLDGVSCAENERNDLTQSSMVDKCFFIFDILNDKRPCHQTSHLHSVAKPAIVTNS
ncbi:LOW QUALITY PROTEIN: hypothetical protein HID58_094314 [Brassica napus]|uniref:Uncharacterized protein n=1 Tax=Brassica napus TaxID=3708 RepID=A0ABQ7XA59_BRANA|nr:LOW QUALITY PROTEIN: hypothetical protein HID58_094314 [Brassica napus]